MSPLRLLLAVTVFASLTSDAPAADPLPRMGQFGATVAPVDVDVRREQKLEPGVGVFVQGVIPGSGAEEAGLKVGDVITAVDGTRLDGPPRFVAKLGRRKAGEQVEVAIVRDGKVQTLAATLKPRPREPGTDAYDVVYDSIPARAGRHRTILTRPKAPGKHPALFLIQGLGGFSIEETPGGPKIFGRILDDFARRGFVTFLVDKPGQGDSEGGPTRDVDFEDELDGYRQGLKALKALDFVDADNVLIFGHSMGGIMGPLIAAEDPVKGIAAYGTAAKTWYEYLLENTRRQMALKGRPAPEIDDALRRDSAINFLVFVEGKSPAEVAEAHPGLRERVGEVFTEGRYYAGRHFVFFKQLAGKNMPAAWEKFGGHALALWGKADFVSTEADHALIAELVNKARPGRGTFLAMDGIDHGFNRVASFEASFAGKGRPGEFNPAIVEVLREWAAKVTGKATPTP